MLPRRALLSCSLWVDCDVTVSILENFGAKQMTTPPADSIYYSVPVACLDCADLNDQDRIRSEFSTRIGLNFNNFPSYPTDNHHSSMMSTGGEGDTLWHGNNTLSVSRL